MFRSFKILTICIAYFGIGTVWAEQTPQANNSHREPQFENQYARAWKTVILPNQPLVLHRHERGRTIIVLRGGLLKVVDRNGKTINTYDWQTGKAYWLDADPPGQQHMDVNDTKSPIEVIVVELKKMP